MAICSSRPTENGRISMASVIAAGCHPSRIASTDVAYATR